MPSQSPSPGTLSIISSASSAIATQDLNRTPSKLSNITNMIDPAVWRRHTSRNFRHAPFVKLEHEQQALRLQRIEEIRNITGLQDPLLCIPSGSPTRPQNAEDCSTKFLEAIRDSLWETRSAQVKDCSPRTTQSKASMSLSITSVANRPLEAPCELCLSKHKRCSRGARPCVECKASGLDASACVERVLKPKAARKIRRKSFDHNEEIETNPSLLQGERPKRAATASVRYSPHDDDDDGDYHDDTIEVRNGSSSLFTSPTPELPVMGNAIDPKCASVTGTGSEHNGRNNTLPTPEPDRGSRLSANGIGGSGIPFSDKTAQKRKLQNEMNDVTIQIEELRVKRLKLKARIDSLAD